MDLIFNQLFIIFYTFPYLPTTDTLLKTINEVDNKLLDSNDSNKFQNFFLEMRQQMMWLIPVSLTLPTLIPDKKRKLT